MQAEVGDGDPYVAVKAIHDALSGDLGADVSVPDQGEVFLVAYLLEKRGVVAPGGGADDPFPSLVDLDADGERLEELFWERERTMWWLAVRPGVHWVLVRYWLYEDDVPLRERNFPADDGADTGPPGTGRFVGRRGAPVAAQPPPATAASNSSPSARKRPTPTSPTAEAAVKASVGLTV